MSGAENYKEVRKEVGGASLSVRTYRIGETWHCHVSNIDPGATIARGEGTSQEEAETAALQKATKRLKRE